MKATSHTILRIRHMARAAAVLALAGVPAVAQTTNHPPTSTSVPIQVSGYNANVVVPSNAVGGDTSPYCQPFDWLNGYAFYQQGLDATCSETGQPCTEGIPVSMSFNSSVDGTLFQLSPNSGNNVLLLTPSGPSGTLVLQNPAAYKSLAILATSANGNGSGFCTINFADGTSSGCSFYAPDWESAGSPFAALTDFGRIYTGNYGAFYTDDETNHTPNLYQTTLNLAAEGLTNKPISSLTFQMATGSQNSSNTVAGIFALSGTPTVAPLRLTATQGTDETMQITCSQPCVLQAAECVNGPYVNEGIGRTFSDDMTAYPARFYRACTLPSSANACTILGQVTDDAGNPLGGITVDLPLGGPSATTDTNGNFVLTNLPPGVIDLEFAANITVTNAAGQTITVKVGVTTKIELPPGVTIQIEVKIIIKVGGNNGGGGKPPCDCAPFSSAGYNKTTGVLCLSGGGATYYQTPDGHWHEKHCPADSVTFQGPPGANLPNVESTSYTIGTVPNPVPGTYTVTTTSCGKTTVATVTVP